MRIKSYIQSGIQDAKRNDFEKNIGESGSIRVFLSLADNVDFLTMHNKKVNIGTIDEEDYMSKKKANCRCIICKKITKASNEHVIPSSLGNNLYITRAVCEKCNNILGGKIETIISDIPLNKFYIEGNNKNNDINSRISILEGIFNDKNIFSTKIEYLKIAYEFAYEVWGDDYLKDDIGKEICSILYSIVNNGNCAYNLDRYITIFPNGRFFDKSEIVDKEVMHSVRIVEGDRVGYVSIELFCNHSLADSVLIEVTKDIQQYKERKNLLQITYDGK